MSNKENDNLIKILVLFFVFIVIIIFTQSLFTYNNLTTWLFFFIEGLFLISFICLYELISINNHLNKIRSIEEEKQDIELDKYYKDEHNVQQYNQNYYQR